VERKGAAARAQPLEESREGAAGTGKRADERRGERCDGSLGKREGEVRPEAFAARVGGRF